MQLDGQFANEQFTGECADEARMECPQCGAKVDFEVWHYDFGVCRETGYHDEGDAAICLVCRHQGPLEDFEL